jgi:hypothetical protein
MACPWSVIYNAGKITLSADMPNELPVAVFSEVNIKKGSVQIKGIKESQILTGAEISYVDPSNHFKRETVRIDSVDSNDGTDRNVIEKVTKALRNSAGNFYVNDKPTGAARLIGASIADSALVVDTSSISDEDGIGGFEITWQRSSSKSSWEAYPTGKNEVLRLTQSQVGYSYRAVVSYIDSHGTREVLYTSPSETIDNLDDPLQGEITITGEPKEGVTLRALSDSLTDEDGIASISISWETSKDGRNWIGVNSLSGPILSLGQSLVGSQVRARVAVVDNFGIETNLYSQATRTVENVNNKPSGRIVIRRVGQ